MKRFAVIGHPIGHSLSPLMHNTAFQLLGLDCNYEMLDIDPSDLSRSIDRFKEENWGGFNVTVPHKESIIPLIDDVAPQARKVGAVNTVVNLDKKLVGYNTDVIGIERSLDAYKEKIKGKPCMIMGTGGAARSLTHVLIESIRPSSITFEAQYPEQGLALVKSVGKCPIELNVAPFTPENIEAAIRDCTLIANATTVGMFPQVQDTPVLDSSLLTDRHIVFDVIYRPLKTRLQKEAEAKGSKTIGGLDMFIHQGAAAFELWTGKKMPISEVRRVLEEKLAL